MPRLKIPSVIALGIIVVVAWLALKPANQPPVGVSVMPSLVPAIEVPVADSGSLAALEATISALLERLEILEAKQNEVKPSVSPDAVPPPVQSVSFQPQTLYLGAGSTTQRDWAETGAQVWINSADYPAGVKAVFEAGLSIVGGEAWARLKNKTSGAILSVTEIFHNTATVTWKTSPAFKLHSGNNLYVVEIRSSSDEVANLSGSRIKLSQ